MLDIQKLNEKLTKKYYSIKMEKDGCYVLLEKTDHNKFVAVRSEYTESSIMRYINKILK